MPPKWVWNLFGILLIICVILGLVFVGYAVITLKSGNGLLTPNTNPAPTVDATRIAQYTPTPGPSSAQMATAVVLAKPTPYVEWTPGDAQMLINGLRDKAIVSEQDINIGAQLSSPGEGHICLDLKTLFDIKVDSYCKISLTWTEWSLAYKPQDLQVKVENGQVETDPSKMPMSADGTHREQRAYAKVTIIVKDIGIVGPTTRFDQSFNFYKDVNAVWKLGMDLKQIIFGDDLRNKANELTADSTNLALADSFAPLMPSGYRSSEYADKLYSAFVDNLTTPGQGHIYNRLLDYATLVANDRRANNDAGYAGLESLTVMVPAKPGTVCDYTYAEDMTTQVLPRKYCVFTYQVTSITDAAKKDLVTQLQQSTDPNIDYGKIIQKLYSIP